MIRKLKNSFYKFEICLKVSGGRNCVGCVVRSLWFFFFFYIGFCGFVIVYFIMGGFIFMFLELS